MRGPHPWVGGVDVRKELIALKDLPGVRIWEDLGGRGPLGNSKNWVQENGKHGTATICCLVVSNMKFYVPFHIWDVILPIDELIFFKMVKTC